MTSEDYFRMLRDEGWTTTTLENGIRIARREQHETLSEYKKQRIDGMQLTISNRTGDGFHLELKYMAYADERPCAAPPRWVQDLVQRDHPTSFRGFCSFEQAHAWGTELATAIAELIRVQYEVYADLEKNREAAK